MSDNKANVVRIDLTPEQKEQVKAATEKNAEAIELTVQELEARIAPIRFPCPPRWAPPRPRRATFPVCAARSVW
jgi:hypothetical protein